MILLFLLVEEGCFWIVILMLLLRIGNDLRKIGFFIVRCEVIDFWILMEVVVVRVKIDVRCELMDFKL